MQMKINFYGGIRRLTESELTVKNVDSLEDLLPRADFITLHVPLTDATYRFIGERELNRMKSTAVLINTSRGTVVDQQALVRALQNGEIGGAGLDVFETEPPDDSELLGLENIVVSPHIAGTTHEALQKMPPAESLPIQSASSSFFPPSVFLITFSYV